MKEIVIGLVSVGILGSGLTPNQEVPTYNQTIAPLIREKCLPCHSNSKGYAPFDFSTYESVTSRIELIRNQVLAQNMPPVWAHSDFGRLATVEQFSDDEAVQLQEWIRLKMPKGPIKASTVLQDKKAKTRTVEQYVFATAQKVKAEGVPYWTVQTKDLNESGGQIDSFWLEPKNPRVVRYAVLAIVPKEMKLPAETVGSINLPAKYIVGVWAPGHSLWQLPNGLSIKFGPNSKLVVQTHLRPTGKAEAAEFKVFLKKPTQANSKSPNWISLEKEEFTIPAGKSEVVEMTYPVNQDVSVISIFPEARFYAGRVQLLYTSKEGASKTVYDNMRWDPYWVGNYMFPKPVILPKGGTLNAKFYYNNDEFCRVNEGKKPKAIKNGPTASDEICRIHLLVEP